MNKNYQEKSKLVDSQKLYQPKDAVELAKKTSWAKFDESVDLAIKLNVDLKKSISIRGTVDLPHGSGKTRIVAVLAKGPAATDAKNAGADIVGAEELIAKITDGFMDFDILLAAPDMMAQVGKLGKVLGTKGLMPNPKSGTVTKDLGPAVKGFKAGKLEFRMDKGGVIHLIIGKVSFEGENLLANLKAVIDAIKPQKPSGTKGAFIKSVTLSSTMGPGIHVDTKEFVE